MLKLPTPVVDSLKLRKRVPIIIKLHELVLKTLNKILPVQILELDRNMSLMLLPLIILGLA